MSQTAFLYQLQEIEHQISDAQARIADIDSQLADDSAVRAAEAAIEQAESKLSPLKKRSRELEHELETTTAKRQQTEDRLYSGNVKNPKELAEMQQEIDLLKSRQNQLEESMLEVMMAAEEAENALQQRRQDLTQKQSTRHSKNDALQAERERKLSEIDRLQQKRAQTVGHISSEALKLYEQLKPRTRQTPVTKMQTDGTCGACGVKQNNAHQKSIRRGALEQCSNCRRIIIFL